MEGLGVTGNTRLVGEDKERAGSARTVRGDVTEAEHTGSLTGHQTALDPKPDAVSKE